MSYQLFKKFAQHHKIKTPIKDEEFCGDTFCNDCILNTERAFECVSITHKVEILIQHYNKFKQENPEYLL